MVINYTNNDNNSDDHHNNNNNNMYTHTHKLYDLHGSFKPLEKLERTKIIIHKSYDLMGYYNKLM